MSSINPVFLLPSAVRANPDGLATGLQASMTLGAGQFCTQPGVVFLVADDDGRRFLERLPQLMQQSPPGIMLTREMREPTDAR